ncbi:hypothetical protein A0257_18660 [Hymenobacter psoromatis]|nr:hypothetical protein A0257_18660 [Hymenobacter psoromatis]
MPSHTDDLSVGLRAATAAAWLAGHEPPIGHGSLPLLQAADHVFHEEAVWLVQARPDAAGKVSLKRISDNRSRSVSAVHCRKLVAPFEFAGLLDDKRAGFRYIHYQEWLDKLLVGTRLAQRVFRMADPDSLPRPRGGHTILLVPAGVAYSRYEEEVLDCLAGAPTCWGRRGTAKERWNLPFAASLHVVASLNEALELRRKKAGITSWHLSVVGKAAVGNSLKVAQLVRAYEQNQWTSLTFWGTDLGVGETPGCVVWPWSRSEARGPHTAPDPVRLTVAAEPPLPPETTGLAARVVVIRDILTALTQTSPTVPLAVCLPLVWHLLHRCLRYALPPSKASATSRSYLAELSRKITDCLDGEELEEAFDDANRWRDLKPTRQALEAAFANLLAYFQEYSPKYDQLRELAAEASEDGQPVVVVADRESLAAVQAVWRTERGVTVLPLLGGPDNVRLRLRKSSFTANTVLLVPFLFNRDQLAELQQSPGSVHLVLLAEVEDGLYARTQESLHQQELAQRQAGGRTAVLGQTYEQLMPREVAPVRPSGAGLAAISQSQQDYFAELYTVGETRYASERQRSRASGQLYTVACTDSYRTELDGHTRVLRREVSNLDPTAAPELTPCQVDELVAGDQVIIYENDQPKLIDQILRQNDRNGLVKRIDTASAIWQQALQQLARCYSSTKALYDALQRQGGLDVNSQTLHNYLDGRRRFPGDPTTLPALLYLAERHELLGCRLLAPGEAEEVKYCRTKFQQLSIALGKGLSDEVLRFRLTGAKGNLLGKLDPDTVELVLLSAVERTIKEINQKPGSSK